MKPDRERDEAVVYEFGEFRLDMAERVLFHDGAPCNLSPKLMDTLIALVERHGHIVEKDSLMEIIWPDSFVEESNLSSNISILRKLIDPPSSEESFIETVPRRGYRFTKSVRVKQPEAEAAPERSGEAAEARKATTVDGPDGATVPVALSETKASRSAKGERKMAVALAAVVLVTAVVAAVYFLWPEPERIDSVAVLPFVNETGSADMDWLSDGMTDDLIVRLSKLSDVRVIARGSVFRFKGTNATPQGVREELDVRSVIYGRVSQRGDDLSIYVEMVDTTDDSVLFTEQYVRQPTGLATVQVDIAREIALRLRDQLTSEEQIGLAPGHTTNPAAYELYLRAKFHWHKFTREGLEKSVEYAREAIGADPEFSEAYSILASSYVVLGTNHIPSAEARPLANEAVAEALRHDPDSAEAQSSKGAISIFFEWDWAAAAAALDRAVELAPTSPEVNNLRYYFFEAVDDQAAAVAAMEKAYQADPLSLIINLDLAHAYFYAGRFEDSLRQYERTIKLYPSSPLGYAGIMRVHEVRGMYDEAAEAFLTSKRLSGDNEASVAALRTAYLRAGWAGLWRAELRTILVSEPESGYRHSAFNLARIYLRLGEKEKALTELEQALADRDPWMLRLTADPYFDSVRDDPRFEAIVQEVGLPYKNKRQVEAARS